MSTQVIVRTLPSAPDGRITVGSLREFLDRWDHYALGLARADAAEVTVVPDPHGGCRQLQAVLPEPS